MIITKIVLTLCGAIMFLMGLTTIVLPDVNSFFVPVNVDNDAMAAMVRTYAGFFLASGYLTIRFVYSSSKVQVGNILLYIFGCMILSRLFSFMYEGFSDHSLYSFFVGVILFLSMYSLQRKRKNQISYDL
mgnify:CR=1 FL=1